MLAWNDWLPDFKGALTGFYNESVKPTVETKTQEFKELVQANISHGKQTQKAVVAILLAVFFLLALALFWTDQPRTIQGKYLALGSLIGYLIPYLISQKVLKE